MTQHDTPPAEPPADRAALRDRIADVLAEADGWMWVTDLDKARSSTYRIYQTRADAVLAAVLPTTDRAAILREAAEFGRKLSRQGYSAQEIAKKLDRLADEAQPAQPIGETAGGGV
jgi:fatty acid-binding protein DegV